MENKVLKLGGERSNQNAYAEIRQGNSERWTIQSQKRKYVNGKLSGVIEVGYSASINTPDYVLEEDKSNNSIQITAQDDGTSGLCILTQNESGNKINLHLTTPEEKEYWEIRFNPITINEVDTSAFFKVTTNISGEGGSMADGNRNKNWIVNQNRYAINVYIANLYPGNFEMLSWSCLIRMVMLLILATIYQVIHTLQQKQLDWVPILLQKFQLPLLAVILLYSPVGLTPLKNIH